MNLIYRKPEEFSNEMKYIVKDEHAKSVPNIKRGGKKLDIRTDGEIDDISTEIWKATEESDSN